ncbi:MAG: MFS transporter, partial [Pseudoxanthomonas sp.]|nr:MFS transporter [Pseudoxanthomonas sp.]
LGGAVAVGGELGGAAGVAVVDTARAAFTGAMRAIAVFGMAMMLLAAWMAARLMRDGEGEAHVAVVAEDAAGA